jgi:hypothetical protein
MTTPVNAVLESSRPEGAQARSRAASAPGSRTRTNVNTALKGRHNRRDRVDFAEQQASALPPLRGCASPTSPRVRGLTPPAMRLGPFGAEMPFHRLICSLTCLLIVFFTGSTAWAQKNVLSANNVELLSQVLRPGVPTVVDVQLNSASESLLEGRLILTLSDGREHFNRVIVDDLVLTTGEQTVRTMLPPVGTTELFGQIQFRLTFEGNGGRIDLGEFLLRTSPYGKRYFVIGTCEPWGSQSQRRVQMREGLRLEQFAPRIDDRADERPVSTGFAHVRPGDLPADPVSYCSFDVLLLVDEGFSLLREPQLNAIAAWVEAGGSLCVAPGGVLKPFQAEFLNRLVSAAGENRPILLDETGRIPTQSIEEQEQLRRVHKGLGRVVLWTAPENVELKDDSDQWREAVAFLWKIRRDRWATIQQTGNWQTLPSTRQSYARRPPTPYEVQEAQQRLSYAPIDSAQGLFDRLMPSTVQLLPLSLVGAILFFYVLAIGPADYFLLGYLRQRKLTWILFPATTVAVTLFTVWLSHEYMKTADNPKAVVFVDMGDAGRIARQNRFEMIFSGTQRSEVAEIRREMFTAFNHRRFVDPMQAYYAAFQPEDRLVAPATYAGRVPLRYSVGQTIPRLTPQLNRRFAIEQSNEDDNGRHPQFDWDDVAVDRLATWEGRTELKKRLQQAFGHDVTIRLYHAQEDHLVSGVAELFPVGVNSPNEFTAIRTGQRVGNFLKDMCVRQKPGLFSVVSQVSPTGGDNFEDLTILDPSDPRQWLLVVAVDRGDELMIYRKLYIDKSAIPTQP